MSSAYGFRLPLGSSWSPFAQVMISGDHHTRTPATDLCSGSGISPYRPGGLPARRRSRHLLISRCSRSGLHPR
jgi:hypothetical protein